MKYLIGYEMPLNSVVGIIVNFLKIFVRDAHPILVPVHLSSITNAVILFASPLAIYSVIDAELSKWSNSVGAIVNRIKILNYTGQSCSVLNEQ